MFTHPAGGGVYPSKLILQRKAKTVNMFSKKSYNDNRVKITSTLRNSALKRNVLLFGQIRNRGNGHER